MKVVSTVDSLGLTKGKEYDVLEQSAGYYKIRLDNGNISYRQGILFVERKESQAAAGP